MREKSRIFFLTFLLILLVAQPVHARRAHRVVQAGFGARSAISMDLSTGRILYEWNADKQIPPASLTKILTLYLTFEALQEHRLAYTDVIDVSRTAAAESGSRMSLRPGERVILREIMKGIAVASGNDACYALAQHLTGSRDVSAFVAAMNVKARELDMTRTAFKNPNGLPAQGQLTTARDMLRLSASYLRHFPQALSLHSMTTYVHNNHSHHNSNRLLTTYPGVDGIKTGFVCASGFNNVVTAKHGNTRVIAVVLGANTAAARTAATARLLDLSFRRIQEGKYVAMLNERQESGVLPAVLARLAPRENGHEIREAVRAPLPAAPAQQRAAVRESHENARKIARAAVREIAAGRATRSKAAMPLVRRRGRAAYAIQVNTFQSRHRAERRAQHLERKGLPVLVVTAHNEGGKSYRVLVGPYASLDAARRTREKLLGPSVE